MVCEPMPKWLSDCRERVKDLGVFGDKTPNHVLVNEYTPGQGIMPHEDGPLYHPVVTTISLGSHTLLDFYKSLSNTDHQDTTHDASYESRYIFSLLLEPRSLLVLQNDMYTRYLHGISQREKDTVSDQQRVANGSRLGQPLSFAEELNRSTRVSLTIRHVPKTFKIKLKLK
ncbi:Alpha-ketoglutarate-dependent dioxygenase alkB homolog 6 [Geodia barretti]|nr:Alpha-ketoglutarate-dependent dioxygenase alkB homolog 6 [Geodia barretti]